MTPDSRSPRHPDELKGARRRREHASKRAFRVLALLIFLMVFCVVGFKVVYPRSKVWRARRMAVEAIALIDQSRTNDALRLLRVAVPMAPTDPDVIRAGARYMKLVGSVDAVRNWQDLANTGKATLEDKVDFLEAAIQARRLDISAQLLVELGAMQSTNMRVLRLGIRHLSEGGFFERAAPLARAAVARDPLDMENHWLLGSALIASTNSAFAEEGREVLLGVARTPGSRRPAAIDRLIRSGRLRTNDVPELVAIVDLERSNITNIVSSLELRWIGRPADREGTLFRALELAGEEERPDRLFALCEWLFRRSPPDALRALTETKAGTHGPLVTLRAETLAATGAWDDLEDYIRRREGVLEQFSVLILRARIAVAKSQLSEAEAAFIGAGEIVSKTPSALVYTARSAETAGLPDVAIRLWLRVLEFPSLRFNATAEVLRLARDRDQLKSEQIALARLCSEVPGDLRLWAERAEREAILGENLESAAQAIERYQADQPKERKHLSALALIRLRQGDAQAALEVFERMPTEWDMLGDRDRVIYVAILGATQQREAARRYARRIDLSKLKSQERELVTPWL
jgi:tetratricopeptide (TPR) repeat protein